MFLSLLLLLWLLLLLKTAAEVEVLKVGPLVVDEPLCKALGPRKPLPSSLKSKHCLVGSGETMIHKQVSLQSINVESGTWASFN